jgi:hypothetical protein
VVVVVVVVLDFNLIVRRERTGCGKPIPIDNQY